MRSCQEAGSASFRLPLRHRLAGAAATAITSRGFNVSSSSTRASFESLARLSAGRARPPRCAIMIACTEGIVVYSRTLGIISRRPCPRVRPRMHATQRARAPWRGGYSMAAARRHSKPRRAGGTRITKFPFSFIMVELSAAAPCCRPGPLRWASEIMPSVTAEPSIRLGLGSESARRAGHHSELAREARGGIAFSLSLSCRHKVTTNGNQGCATAARILFVALHSAARAVYTDR